MISGDNVLGLGTVLIAPPEGDMTLYLKSLERMADRPIGFMFPAHGPPIAAAKQRIQFYIDHRLQRERSILAALEATAMSIPSIALAVYTDIDPRAIPLAEINVRAHLGKLLAEGRVRKSADGEFAAA